MTAPRIMTVDRLEIQNFGSVKPLKMKFKKGANVIQDENSKQVQTIIGAIASGSFDGGEIRFKAECTLDGQKIVIDSSKNDYLPSLTSLEKRLCSFDAKSKYDWSREFFNYCNEDEIVPFNPLAKQTSGISLTQNFRMYLNRYTDEMTASGVMDEQGVFCRKSGVGAAQFNFECYVRTLEFWDGFNEIRDINHIRMPVLISGKNLNTGLLKNRQSFLL